MKDSTVIFEGHPAWEHYTLQFGVAALLLLGSFKLQPLFVAAACVAAAAVLKRLSCHGKVTDTRIITKFGLFSTKTYEIEIKDIRSINVSQTVLQKVFRIGDLEFATASGPMKEAALLGIKAPETLKEQIRALHVNE